MTSVDRSFEAPDLIEVMDEAVNYNRYLIDAIAEWAPEGGTALDFGAGNGRFAGALHERGLAVEAVEPDPVLRGRIEARGVPAHEGLDALSGRQFDAVYSINVLEHIDDDVGILRQIRERLRVGGHLLVYVPAFPVLFSANDRRVGHVRRYLRSTLVEAVGAAGFDVQSVGYVDSIGFVAGLAYRLFGDRSGDLNVKAVQQYDRFLFPWSRRVDAVTGARFGKNLMLHAIRGTADGPRAGG